MVKNCQAKKLFFGSLQALLVVLGQDQQQHPAVHTEELAEEGSVAMAVGVSDR